MDAPILIKADADEILKETVTIWESMAGKKLVTGQPDYLLAATLAYQKYLLLQRVNSAFLSMLLDFAGDATIDYIVALLGVVRIGSQPATCTLRFNLIPGHGNLTISAGTRVSSQDGLAVFEVDQDTYVDSSVDTILTNATCEVNGVIGNNYQIGTVSTIMDPMPYISTAINVDITANGCDIETTEELRSRAKLATSIFSTAGPKDAYIYFTKSVSPLIVDVQILTSDIDGSISPGEVHVFALLQDGQKPNDSLNALILSTLSDEKIRPLTDTVIVASPSDLHYTIQVDIIKLKAYTGTTDSIVSLVSSILDGFKKDKYQKLGLDIVCSEIETLCRVPGVYDLNITILPPIGRTLTGRNLIVNQNEYAILDSYTVNVTGSNNG